MVSAMNTKHICVVWLVDRGNIKWTKTEKRHKDIYTHMYIHVHIYLNLFDRILLMI